MRKFLFNTGSALDNGVPSVSDPVIIYPGRAFSDPAISAFGVDEDNFSRHILLLGGSGCGKTNAFLYAIRAVRQHMAALGSGNDIAIIFDTKGEFYDRFFQPGDYVIGNGVRFHPVSYTWNLFDEILADGADEGSISVNAREISAALFHGRGSATQPFFCNAARDIFRGLLIHFIRGFKTDPSQWGARLNNAVLTEALQSLKIDEYRQIFESHPDTQGLLSYFGDGTSNQALSVFGELNSMVSEYFMGILSEHRPDRSLSMREAVRKKGGKAVFIEYDLAMGETLAPVYRVLLDQALKEALGRSAPSGGVYVFADEFKLLPKLQHIDDALNFGRGQGVKIMAGIQSIDQMFDIYGRDRGTVVASGFGSLFAFHTNDYSSREYIARRFGGNIEIYDYFDEHEGKYKYREREGHTVSESDQIGLGVGQAFIGLGYERPFLFKFQEFQKSGV